MRDEFFVELTAAWVSFFKDINKKYGGTLYSKNNIELIRAQIYSKTSSLLKIYGDPKIIYETLCTIRSKVQQPPFLATNPQDDWISPIILETKTRLISLIP